MLGLRRLGAAAAALLCLLSAITSGASAVGAAASPISNLTFGRPPTNLANHQVGSILRSRSIDAEVLGLPLGSWATEILFRSVDAQGQPSADITTVLVPKTPWRGPGTRPIVSYQTAEDGLGVACAPSNALQVGLQAATSNAELETIDIAAVLAQGWAVITTDYEGPSSEFLDGPQEGYAVLDGIRAALAAHPHGLSPRARLAMWGYSGGGFATAWAIKLRSSHAPGLRVTAVALGDTPSDLATTMRNVDGGYGFGLVFGGFVGIDRGDPSAHLSSLLNARGLAAMMQSEAACTVPLLAEFAFQRLASYTTSAHPFDTPALKSALAANSLASITTSAPVYDYHTTTDELVPVRVANTFVAKSCAAGDRIQAVRTPLNTHITEQLVGAPGAIQFLARRFGGAPVVDNCPN
jgi:hypothetical protein